MSWIDKVRLRGFAAYSLVIAATLAIIAVRYEIVTWTGARPGFDMFAPAFLVLPLLTARRYWIISCILAVVYGWHFILPADHSVLNKTITCALFCFEAVLIAEVVNTLRVTMHQAEKARLHAEYLQQELSHRVQNVLAVVMVLLQKSQRQDYESPERAICALRNQVTALSLANTALDTKPDGPTFELRRLLASLLAPYQSDKTHSSRIVLIGPKLVFPGSMLSTLGIALHELATNSAKHGALGTATGHVTVRWTVGNGQSQGPDIVSLIWEDVQSARTIQTPDPDKQKTHGLDLLRTAASHLGGSVSFEFNDHGVRVHFTFPRPETHQNVA